MHLMYFLYLWTIVFQNAVKNCSLRAAAEEQRKVDEKVKELAEEHKVYNCYNIDWTCFRCDVETIIGNRVIIIFQKQKEKLHKRIIQLETQLDAKQALQLEIEQLRGQLNVMKYMGDEEDLETLYKVEFLLNALKEKEGALADLQALNQTLVVQERKRNDELQDARKELVNVRFLIIFYTQIVHISFFFFRWLYFFYCIFPFFLYWLKEVDFIGLERQVNKFSYWCKENGGDR